LCTNFLDKETIPLVKPNTELGLLMALSFDYLNTVHSEKDPLFQDTFAWQMHGFTHWVWRYHVDGELIEALINPIDLSQFEVRFNDKTHTIRAHLTQAKLRIETNTLQCNAVIQDKKQHLIVYTEQGQLAIERFNWAKVDAHSSANKGQLTAPMPSTVVSILTQVGETVKAGDKLLVLEAMKMEHTIHAPADGVVSDIFYDIGAQVDEGAQLLAMGES
jgi:3-methylcrotonyl-CoA carboxylase alpha subunit